MKLFRTLTVALAIMQCTPARADLTTQMDQMFNTLSNVSVPGSFETQARGTISGGSLYVRSKIVNASLFHIEPPGFRAGCGGLDFFAGSFSWANSEQLQLLAQSIAANAAGYAFQLAMKQLCPECMNVIAGIMAEINKLNQYAGNSCQLAKGLVNDTLSAATGQKNNGASLISVFEGIGDTFDSFTSHDGQTPVQAVEDNAPDVYGKVVTGNLVWRELRKHAAHNWIGGGGTDIMEVMMNVTGTVIVDSGVGSNAEDVRVQIVPGNTKILEAILQGDPVTIFRCDDTGVDQCLSLIANTNVVFDKGFRQRIYDYLTDPAGGLIAAISGSATLSASGRQFVSAMPASAGSMLVRLASISPEAARTFADEASMQIAIEMTRQLITSIFDAVRISGAGLTDAYAKQVADLIDQSSRSVDSELARLSSVYGNVFDLLQAYNGYLAVLPTGDYGLTTRAIPGI